MALLGLEEDGPAQALLGPLHLTQLQQQGRTEVFTEDQDKWYRYLLMPDYCCGAF